MGIYRTTPTECLLTATIKAYYGYIMYKVALNRASRKNTLIR
jgi:hypothetical protein